MGAFENSLNEMSHASLVAMYRESIDKHHELEDRANLAEAALVALWRDPENQLGIHVWMDAGILLDDGTLAPWFAKLLEGEK